MGDMRIRLDEPLQVVIEERARLNARSVEDEVVQILKSAMEPPRQESLYEATLRITAMTPSGVQQTDSVEMLREDRNR